MFTVLIPLPHLRYSQPRFSWPLPMERRQGTRYPAWDYDQRDIAIHPERWFGVEDECLTPSWDPAWSPFTS